MIFILIFIGLFAILGVSFKISSRYKPSIYNYESYMSKDLIHKINQKYSYRLFGEVNEFTRALDQGKALAGVGSDYQIAQLIYQNQIRKINYSKLNKNILDWDDVKTKQQEEDNKAKILSLFNDIVVKHMAKFDDFIKREIEQKNPKNVKIKPHLLFDENNQYVGYSVDGDDKKDEFYQYVIPYFYQDKIVAYNINKQSRPYIKDIENVEQKMLEIKNKDYADWNEIYQVLRNAGYHNYGWTNSFLDNLMLGSFYQNSLSHSDPNYKQWIDKNHQLIPFDETNYKDSIEMFAKFVQKATGHDLKETKNNKLISNGLQLVTDLIDPDSTKLDVGLMYNGDVLDAYYSNDNFASLEDGQSVGYIRPSENMLLLDAWIISTKTPKKEADNFLEYVSDILFTDLKYSVKELEKLYYEEIEKKVVEQILSEKSNTLSEEEVKNSVKNAMYVNPKDENSEINKEFFQDHYDVFSDSFDFTDSIINFDAINYTPTVKSTYEFIKKYYFRNEDMTNDEKALDIYKVEENSENQGAKIYHHIYQPTDNKLRSKIIQEYYNKTVS
ncbi:MULTISPECIES: hypothetical protein [unclassified Mycoplasma]